jgi:hypothetical protein
MVEELEMKPVHRLPLNDPCHCGSGRKYKRCCFANDREGSKLKRYLYLFLMTHGTGDAGRTTNSKVLKSWANIEGQIHHLDIKFDKAYTDSDYPREELPIEGIKINTNGNINLDELDPQWSVLYYLAKRNPQLNWVPCESRSLMEEYRSIMSKQLEREATGNLTEHCEEEYYDIINKRDSYIAKRIKEDLKIGEVGVLFLGKSHNEGDGLANSLREDGIEVKVIKTVPCESDEI